MTVGLLLSGGMDSTAIAWWKRPQICLTVDYGQLPANAEIRAASAIANAIDADHYIIRANLHDLGSGDMAGRTPLDVAPVTEWWPYRNQMLVTLAAMKAVALGVDRLLIGCLKTDGLHADGRPEFVNALDKLLSLQEGQMRIEAPALQLDAVGLVATSKVPIEVLAWSHSCHVAEQACGECRGCRKHYETMHAMGLSAY